MTAQAARTQLNAMEMSGEYPVGVRKKYAARACDECQRRKRRCTAERVCRTCRHSGTECVYSTPRSSRQRRIMQSLTPTVRPGDWSATGFDHCLQTSSNLGASDENASANSELLSRTQNLEQCYEGLKQRMAKLAQQGPDRSISKQLPVTELPGPNGPLSPSSTLGTNQEPSRNNVFERNTKFMGGSSFFRQIDILDQSVARDLWKGEEFLFMPPEEGQAMDYENLSAGLRRELDEIVEQIRSEDVDRSLQSLDIYFATIHPHYPCINEAHLRSQFAGFLANDPNCMSKNVTIQYAALLNFVMAVVRVLYDNCPEDNCVPGWKEFYRAEKLLSHATWLEKANIMTIQILLVKTCYCLYITRLNAAYDTMGTAVRLCFQLGLHNEPSWGESCNFYDRTYRQRVFWSIYCLNHVVSQKSGVPDLIRESDFDVELPKCVDDRMLYPNCPPLPEFYKASHIPYLLEIIKWAKLSSEIWDGVFGVGAKKPVSQELIAATDNKIMELSIKTPTSLHWPPASGLQSLVEVPSFIVQQSFIYYLRIRHLRMLLRREEMVSLRYQRRTAQLCIEIAMDVVNAVELHSSGVPKRTERYAYVLHLTGAVVPMICVIVQKKNSEDLVRPAIDLMTRALRILENLSYGLSFARRTLRQLQRPIRTAREIIDSNWPQYSHSAFAPNSFNPMGAQGMIATPTSLSQNYSWNEGNVVVSNICTDTGAADSQMPVDDNLIWDNTDLWLNDMNNWCTG